jgi:Fe-S oxidoreductase
MATRNEQDSTRARANLLRQVLTSSNENALASPEIHSVMDLCLSCKACKAECPSNVDVARLKAEALQHHHDLHGIPLRTRIIAGFSRAMRLASLSPRLYNAITRSPGISSYLKQLIGFAEKRSLPPLHPTTLTAWHRRNANPSHYDYPNGTVHLFCDEFTNYNDTPIGIQAIQLLNRLGYRVLIPHHLESGRAHLSKGLVRKARDIATQNVRLLHPIITASSPLIGIEPSAILGFRDEYPDLVPPDLKSAAQSLASNTFLIDEFLAREADANRITSHSFTHQPRHIKLHGHCHQKALSSITHTVRILEIPSNHTVSLIPSGCCGMAGSFGYETEHHTLSQQIGELVLFPAVRSTPHETLIAAPGTSCRHQILDATGRHALHPVEILHTALKH